MKKWSYLISLLLFFSILNAAMADEDKTESINNLLKKSIVAIQDQHYKEALTFIHQAKNIDSKMADIYRLEGQLLEMLGNIDEAIIAWQNCIKYADSETIIEEAEVHLNHLMD
ncbi:MAG: hypothetical protein IIB95_11050 [Candidatus Marinimicrobia bacterium]|nr:hypothetical protein [Candidatus Neomarinimicrobiota bacterium]MCH7764254.1 hypothetical protein [Candidatus Neomarinimicrobiota bacterium]